MQNAKKRMSNSSNPTLHPMQVLKATSPEGAATYLEFRRATMDNPALQALAPREKLLIGVAVAVALQSSMCALTWAKQARDAGATDAEIVEAMLVARLLKAATVNDTAAEPLGWLAANPQVIGTIPERTASSPEAVEAKKPSGCCGS
jgi:AhpD family alkylhydroperoxidase